MAAVAMLSGISQQPKRSSLDEAVDFVMKALQDGDQPAKTIERDALRAGISERTLKRAKKELGIRSEKQGDEWFWKMPQEDDE